RPSRISSTTTSRRETGCQTTVSGQGSSGLMRVWVGADGLGSVTGVSLCDRRGSSHPSTVAARPPISRGERGRVQNYQESDEGGSGVGVVGAGGGGVTGSTSRRKPRADRKSLR